MQVRAASSDDLAGPGRPVRDAATCDPGLGLRRVSYVRVRIGDAWVRAEVVGVGHRWPRSVPVPLSVAARLAAAGVPIVVRREDG